MYRTAVVVADTSRARLFTFGRTADPSGPVEPLTEVASLSARSPRSRSAPSGVDQRVEFARSIDRWVEDLIDEAGISRLVLCAPLPVLRTLREVMRPRHNVLVEELPRSLTTLSASQLGEELVAAGRMSRA